jgi:hypothetical protein
MATHKKRRDGDSPASATPSGATGRESIHGNHEDYGDRVAERAYELYLERGRSDGQDFDDWLAAERELSNGHDRPSDSDE